MMRLHFSLGLSGLLALGALTLDACSSSNNTPADGGVGGATGAGGTTGAGGSGVKVTVSGTASPHALAAGGLDTNAAANFNMMLVAVVDPVTVLANANAAPLAGGALDTSATNCGTRGCAWSFDNVNIGGITLGLVGIVDDARTSNRLWVKTGTGAGSAASIMAVIQNPMPITNVPLFGVSKAMEAKLAAFAAGAIPDTTIVAGTLETRGFMLGTVVNKGSEGAMPVAGAKVTTNDSRVTIIYPSADFMSVGTSTAAHGTILVVPKPASPLTSV